MSWFSYFLARALNGIYRKSVNKYRAGAQFQQTSPKRHFLKQNSSMNYFVCKWKKTKGVLRQPLELMSWCISASDQSGGSRLSWPRFGSNAKKSPLALIFQYKSQWKSLLLTNHINLRKTYRTKSCFVLLYKRELTVCQRSLVHFYKYTRSLKMDKTSCTCSSTKNEILRLIAQVFLSCEQTNLQP